MCIDQINGSNAIVPLVSVGEVEQAITILPVPYATINTAAAYTSSYIPICKLPHSDRVVFILHDSNNDVQDKLSLSYPMLSLSAVNSRGSYGWNLTATTMPSELRLRKAWQSSLVYPRTTPAIAFIITCMVYTAFHNIARINQSINQSVRRTCLA